MHACMYVCMYACINYLYTHFMLSNPLYIHTHTHTHMHTHPHVDHHLSRYVYIHLHLIMYLNSCNVYSHTCNSSHAVFPYVYVCTNTADTEPLSSCSLSFCSCSLLILKMTGQLQSLVSPHIRLLVLTIHLFHFV